MEQDLTDLRDHAAVFRRRYRLIVLLALLGALAGVVLSLLQSPLYTAESSLELQDTSATSTTSGSSSALDSTEVATQVEVILSDPVARRVIKRLKLDTSARSLEDSVTAAAVTDTRVVQISASRPTGQEAAAVANAFAQEYIALRQKRLDQAGTASRNAYVTQLSTIQQQIDRLRGKLTGVTGVTGTQARDLRQQIQALQAQQSQLRASLLTSQSTSTSPTTPGAILQTADAPGSPTQPQPVRASLLGLIIGLILGIVLAYLRDRTDDGIRDEARVVDALHQVPILGRIPTEPSGGRGRVATLLGPHGYVSEAYRSLNTNVRFLLAASQPGHHSRADGGRPGGFVLIASATAGEGKTSVATNLAVAASGVGLRVLLVDADLRHPSVAQRFGLEESQGLSDLLVGDHPLETYLLDVGVEHLSVLPAGSTPPNPVELLASPRARVVWKELRAYADLIIVDSTPVLGFADTLELVRESDELILVARQDLSRARLLSSAAQRVDQVGGHVSGAVINDVPVRTVAFPQSGHYGT